MPEPTIVDPKPMPTSTTQTEPTTQTTTSSGPTTEAPPSQATASDIVKRLSQQPVSSPPVEGQELPAEFRLNKEEFLKDVTDPQKRATLEAKLTAIDRAANDKFQKMAEMRKQAEAQLALPWTPERVNALMSDPKFVESAKAIVMARQGQPSGQPAPATWEGSPDEWSALSDKEKQAFLAIQKQAEEANRKADSLIAQQEQMRDQQEHERLKTKYPDYEPHAVEGFMRAVVENRISPEALKEAIHKALAFDRTVENSYRFGLQDRQGALTQKVEGATTQTGNITVTSAEAPEKARQPGEKSNVFFKRLADWNLLHK